MVETYGGWNVWGLKRVGVEMCGVETCGVETYGVETYGVETYGVETMGDMQGGNMRCGTRGNIWSRSKWCEQSWFRNGRETRDVQIEKQSDEGVETMIVETKQVTLEQRWERGMSISKNRATMGLKLWL